LRDQPKAIVSWSSGKDSAMSLYILLKLDQHEIRGLFTTVSDVFRRVSMHGVREALLDSQAISVGLPLEKIRIPYPCPNEVYEQEMSSKLLQYKARGITHIIFGDLFLEDIRKYREEKLSLVGITPIFPLWKEDTMELAKKIVEAGFRAIITCVDETRLKSDFAGREFDEEFLADLPSGIDPCGENGEFHTFVYDGPIFRKRVNFVVGEGVTRDGFRFTDLLPVA